MLTVAQHFSRLFMSVEVAVSARVPHKSLTKSLRTDTLRPDSIRRVCSEFGVEISPAQQQTVARLLERCIRTGQAPLPSQLTALCNELSAREVRYHCGGALDLYFTDKLIRFQQASITPFIDFLGLVDRVREAGLVCQLYRGNFSGPWLGEYVLALSGSWHDATAALFKDGKLVSALEEERLSRTKHDQSRMPINAIRELLSNEGIGLSNIRAIAIGWNNNLFLGTPHCAAPAAEFFSEMDSRFIERTGIPRHKLIRRPVLERNTERFNPIYMQKFLAELGECFKTSYQPLCCFVSHHHSHAASAYYFSGFKDPVLAVTLDGYGDLESGGVWHCVNGEMRRVATLTLPNSLGWVWATITEYLGFKPTLQEGEVMGLAPYGAPRDSEEKRRVSDLRAAFSEIISFNKKTGLIEARPEYFYFGKILEGKIRVTEKLSKLLGGLVRMSHGSSTTIEPLSKQDRPLANLAFTLQEVTNRLIADFVRFHLAGAKQRCGATKLALAGGIALNIMANGRLVSSGIVRGEDLFIQPLASDAGTALGAGATVSRELLGQDPRIQMRHAYWGTRYSNAEVEAALKKRGLKLGEDYEYVGEDKLIDAAATDLKHDHPILWFQGRCEVGPRSLGARSLLLNVIDNAANNTANDIKGRQHWRPSACSITLEDAQSHFEGIGNAPFMITALPVKKDKRQFLQSGTHQYGDKLGRPQTVDRETNPRFWMLLKKLGATTGVPAVVNTSFNRQEPIVESPDQALDTFYYMDGVKTLYIENFIVRRTSRLSPVVLSLQESPEFERLIEQGDINRWRAALQDIVRRHSGSRKIRVCYDSRLENGGCIEIPILKDLFEGRYREQVRRAVAALVYNDAVLFGAHALRVGMEDSKNGSIVRSIIEETVRKFYPRIDYFASGGDRVKVLPLDAAHEEASQQHWKRELFRLPAPDSHEIKLGIDVGATRLKVVQLVGNQITEREIIRLTPTSRMNIGSVIYDLVRKYQDKANIAGVGLALPGVISSDDRVLWLVNFEHHWRKKGEDTVARCYKELNELKERLSSSFKIPHVRLINDATAFGVSALEYTNHSDAVIVTLGTGVGVARIFGGEIDLRNIEQSGAVVLNVSKNAPYDTGTEIAGSFAAYSNTLSFQDLSTKFGLTELTKRSPVTLADVNRILMQESGRGKAEAQVVCGEFVKPIASWIELVHRVRGDKKFFFAGGWTDGEFGKYLLAEIRHRLRSKPDIFSGVEANLLGEERVFSGARGAAMAAIG